MLLLLTNQSMLLVLLVVCILHVHLITAALKEGGGDNGRDSPLAII
jgi:hypothetical protein